MAAVRWLLAWLMGIRAGVLRGPPRLTPGIRCDVLIVLGDNGTVGIFPSKLPEEEDAGEIYRTITLHWISFLNRAGISPVPPEGPT